MARGDRATALAAPAAEGLMEWPIQFVGCTGQVFRLRRLSEIAKYDPVDLL